VPHRAAAAALLLQEAPELEGAVPLQTAWPRRLVRPRGLACSDASGPAVAAIGQFGLFSARLPSGTAGISGAVVNFTATGGCPAIEGESLSDAAFACASSPSQGVEASAASSEACDLLVLHRQGTLLSMCSGTAASASTGQAAAAAGSVSAAWLYAGDAATGRAQEEVTSLAVAPGSCGGGGPLEEVAGSRPAEGETLTTATVERRCAYAETSGERIVEVRTTAGPPDGAARSGGHDSGLASSEAWFPTRVVRAQGGATSSAAAPRAGGGGGGATLRLLTAGDGTPYLGTLRNGGPRGKQWLEVLEPRSGQPVGTWQLPAEQAWGSMCSTGGFLYLLSEGRSPQLYRLPLPAALGSATGVDAPLATPPAHAAAEAVATSVGRSSPSQRGALRGQRGHATLAVEKA